MGSQVLVSLLISVVFWDVVEVVSSDDDGSVHLGGHNGTGKNSASDGDLTNKWALLVNVGTLDGRLRGLDSQANLLVPSLGSSVGLSLWVGEDVRLLVSTELCQRACRGFNFFSKRKCCLMLVLQIRDSLVFSLVCERHQ